MKEKKSVAELLKLEQEKLAKYEKKREDLDEKIKTCKENITKYSLMNNSERLLALSDTLGGKGISIEEIISAVAGGDLTALQDKIDNARVEENALEYDVNTNNSIE